MKKPKIGEILNYKGDQWEIIDDNKDLKGEDAVYTAKNGKTTEYIPKTQLKIDEKTGNIRLKQVQWKKDKRTGNWSIKG